MPVGKVAITWVDPRNKEGPRGCQGSNSKRVAVTITPPENSSCQYSSSTGLLTPCQYSSSTGFPPAFLSVDDTVAYFLLPFPNQTNLQKSLWTERWQEMSTGGKLAIRKFKQKQIWQSKICWGKGKRGMKIQGILGLRRQRWRNRKKNKKTGWVQSVNT